MITEKTLTLVHRKTAIARSDAVSRLSAEQCSFRAVSSQIDKGKVSLDKLLSRCTMPVASPGGKVLSFQRALKFKQELLELHDQKGKIATKITGLSGELKNIDKQITQLESLQAGRLLKRKYEQEERVFEEIQDLSGLKGEAGPINNVTMESAHIRTQDAVAEIKGETTRSAAERNEVKLIVEDTGALSCNVTGPKGEVIQLSAHVDEMRRIAVELASDPQEAAMLRRNRGVLKAALKKESIRAGLIEIKESIEGGDASD